MFENKKISLFIPSLRGGGAERMMVVVTDGFSKEGISGGSFGFVNDDVDGCFL